MIEDLINAAILGIVQGITEFLPVSSTGHLILTHEILGTDEERYGLSFDASIHLGTLLAVLWYFREMWLRMARATGGAVRTRSLAAPDARLAALIALGTVPAAVIGLLFEDQVEEWFRSPALVGGVLIAFSAVFLLAEAVSRRTRTHGDMTWFDAVVIGFAQAVALVPGVSRSGATISAGLFRHLSRTEAASFAFLLSAPVIAGAGTFQFAGVLRDVIEGALDLEDLAFFAVGFVCAAIVGYLAIAFLLRFLATNSLRPFVVYRVTVGLIALVVFL
jgi:undecaprenyl-diphosphatase